jgi:hypothetical protein
MGLRDDKFLPEKRSLEGNAHRYIIGIDAENLECSWPHTPPGKLSLKNPLILREKELLCPIFDPSSL